MQVRDVMTYGVIGLSEGASVAEAVETMLRSHVSALFVFNPKNERLAESYAHEHGRKVGEVMTSDVETRPPPSRNSSQRSRKGLNSAKRWIG